MSNFDTAIKTILAHEGGYVNDPVDNGGETNFGISMRFLKSQGVTAKELGLQNLDPGCLKSLTADKAKEIYRKYFWDSNGFDAVKDVTVATKLFDAAVNMGGKQAAKLAQRAANDCGYRLDVDGQLGTKSFAAINLCDPATYIRKYAKQMEDFYNAIIAKNPAQIKFKKGWMKRANWGV